MVAPAASSASLTKAVTRTGKKLAKRRANSEGSKLTLRRRRLRGCAPAAGVGWDGMAARPSACVSAAARLGWLRASERESKKGKEKAKEKERPTDTPTTYI